MKLAWQIVRLLWTVAINIVYVAIVWSVIERTYDENTRLILSAIGLTYVAIRNQAIGAGIAVTTLVKAAAHDINSLKALLIADFVWPDTTAQESNIMWQNLRFSVEGLGLIAVALICVFQGIFR